MLRIAISLLMLISVFFLTACDGAAPSQRSPKPIATPVAATAPTPAVPAIPAKSQCEAPPYGDTQENYTRFSNSMQGASADPAVAKMLQIISQMAISTACKIKFENADRTEYHTWGISDDDIAVTSPVGLALQDINYHNHLGAKSEPVKETYQTISVRNFVIDGPHLAATHAKVDLVGVYVLQGSLGMLYTDTQAVIMAKYNSAISTQPSVALLTDDASHKLREDLLSCSSNPGAQLGCKVEIRGEATICTLSNAFGAAKEEPCINGEDGGYWSAPAPVETIAASPTPPTPDSTESAAPAVPPMHQFKRIQVADISPVPQAIDQSPAAPSPPPAQAYPEQKPAIRAHSAPFLIRGVEKRCNDITQLDSSLSTSYDAYFDRWTRADYDEAIIWSTECAKYGWQSIAGSRVSLLQAREASAFPR
jgi:hypothetical protein